MIKLRIAVSAAVVLFVAAVTAAPARSAAPDRGSGGDRDVSFYADGVHVYGSLRVPDGPGPHPAAVLLAGSGPVDRNGNSPLIPGNVDTLRHLADVLAEHGVASLRYDKLGTGETGLGPFAGDPSAIGFDDYVDEAAAGLSRLAGAPGVDRHRLMLVGHSEGTLISLAVVTGGASIPAPRVRQVALLEGTSGRYLDLIRQQLHADWAAEEQAGTLTAGQVAHLEAVLDRAIRTLRTTGEIPADLPLPLQQAGLVPQNAKFLYQADRDDPTALARSLPRRMPTLDSCSLKDIVVSCTQEARLATTLAGGTRSHHVTMLDADHVLKDVGPGPSTGQEYGEPLPFDPKLDRALAAWATDHRR